MVVFPTVSLPQLAMVVPLTWQYGMNGKFSVKQIERLWRRAAWLHGSPSWVDHSPLEVVALVQHPFCDICENGPPSVPVST
jgi:hypothetical protein